MSDCLKKVNFQFFTIFFITILTAKTGIVFGQYGFERKPLGSGLDGDVRALAAWDGNSSQAFKILSQERYDYLITVGNEQLQFLRRPELGYVVQSRDDPAAVKALDGVLRQFGATDIKPVRGLSRKGVSVVHWQRLAVQNENIIAIIRTHPQIRYTAPLFSSNGQTVAIIPEIVVRLTSQASEEQLRTLCRTMNLTIKNKMEFTEKEYLINVPATDEVEVFNTVEQLNQIDFIEWAAPNVAFQPQLLGQVIPDDEYFPNQWHLNNTGQSGGMPGADINAPAAWEITTGDLNIVVAVLDEGVDTYHPDLIENIVAGYDFYDNDNDASPTGDDAHGTACAGLIAAKGNNGIGVTGVAWNCKIMPIRIAGGGGNFIAESDIATAIRWAANNGADVLSNSWGGNFEMPIIHSAIVDVTLQGGIGREGKGCVVLFASGNWVSGGSVIYPAIYSEVIAVGATDHNDVVWSYSGSGPALDIVAPSGECDLLGNIWTTDIVGSAGYNNTIPGIFDYTDKMGGTSGACPIAAGVAALILSVDPNLTNIDVKDVLQNSAMDLGSPGFDNFYGCGRIDVFSALDIISRLPRQQWIASYTGKDGWANAIVTDYLGNVYVAGSSYSGATKGDYLIIKYDSDGHQLWIKTYDGPAHSYDEAKDIASDDSGNVYVTGRSFDSSYKQNYVTIKYDSNGNELWAKRYNGPGNWDDYAQSVCVDKLGNTYVTGYSWGTGTHFDYVTIKYSPNGDELWIKRYNGPGNDGDYAEAVVVDNSCNVYVTGASPGSSTSNDYATIKYDSNGNVLWMARYNGPGNGADSAKELAVDGLGNVYVTGESFGSSTNYDYATIKYDPNGNELWVARYNGPGNNYDSASALAVDSLGNVYVTGTSKGSGSDNDYATIKYDPNGNELWTKRYNGTGNGDDSANAIALDDSGNVFVTGQSTGNDTGEDYVTIQYDRDGNQLWIKRYNNNSYLEDLANALVVDDSGSVYVTGKCWDSATTYRVAVTIKYTYHNYCTATIAGDLNCNCKVDFADYAILANDWLIGSDLYNLATLANNWLKCNFALEEDCW